MKDTDKTTDFGFERVSSGQKEGRVRDVFDSVAERYDLMNDVMSLGIHRLWKKFAIEKTHVRPGQNVLDVAAGTGDLTSALCRRVGKTGQVVMSDINPNMLRRGRARLLDAGVGDISEFVIANAEKLPFSEDSFDCVTIGFGLRNVTDKTVALKSMFDVLKPGGQLLILEFSRPTTPGLGFLYDQYSFRVLPLMGRLIARDAASYQYLVESIRMHPDQEDLKQMMRDVGFEQCQYYNLSGGIVAVHSGFKH